MERATRGRPRGKGRGGRGKRGKPRQVVSEEEEVEKIQQNEQDPVKEENPEEINNSIEMTAPTMAATKSPQIETAVENNSMEIVQEVNKRKTKRKT